MDRADVLAYIKAQRYAVVASASSEGTPQAAVVGIAVTDDFEIVFDTLSTTRKARNLLATPSVAFVIGGLLPGDERSVQYEGRASFPVGERRAQFQAEYFKAFPDGRSRLSWPDITYVCVKPTWLRFSDFNVSPPSSVEFDF